MTYNFRKIEKKWQKEWDEKKIFHAKENKSKKKCYILEMFPYPSASGLHMGHVLNYAIGDIYARFKRMQGMNVLYPMGFDALGLPAENAAIKAGEHPKTFTLKAIKNYQRQMKEIGLSYDWSRTLSTMDPEYYKWNQYFFLKFLEKGLIYRKKAPVNWCPKCNSVLANEQVHGGKCWRHEDTEIEIKHLEQWFIKTTKYADELLGNIEELDWPERIKLMQRNWIGKSFGSEILFDINGEKWPIFTTRPDTLFGVTFMVISAQHPRLMELVTKEQKKDVEKFLKKIKSVSRKSMKDVEELDKEGVFTGSYAINPLSGEKVPVYAGNFVVADYGSGMVMAVPAHDQRDFEFAKKYNIPVKWVIKPDISSYMVIEKSLSKDKIKDLDKYGEINIEKIDKDWGKFIRVNVPIEKENNFIKFLENNLLSESEDGGAWYADSINTTNVLVFPKKHFIIEDKKDYQDYLKYGLSVGILKEQLTFELKAYTSFGKLINSKGFDGLNSSEAKEHITIALKEKKLGKKVIQYKLRDWLVSRQRYWGTPIPVIYCGKCGIVPVPEKQLPIKLPDKVEFGKGNPLLTNKEWVNTRCPKCGGTARRETDTMDTFFDSSWYYLRYCDNKNSRLPFDKKKIDYWMPVDQYIGGAEHACMHLIYARFFTKALRDLGFLDFDEPFKTLFNQGMLHGKDGEKMSKSKGNVINPDEVSKNYGMDTARLFLLSLASPEKDRDWSEEGILGSLRFMNKIISYFENVKIGKADSRTESKLNKSIKEITKKIDSFEYNLAIINLRELFDSLPEETSKGILDKSLKLLSPFCPHVAEELWHNLGNKTFISTEKWPVADESKIDENLEKQEQSINELGEDINNILKILSAKGEKPRKAFVYVIPKEKEIYSDTETLEKKTNLEIRIFAVNEKDKYDPKGVSSKTKPGKPGIYLE
jgi:leucyl-tRNA synthetase